MPVRLPRTKRHTALACVSLQMSSIASRCRYAGSVRFLLEKYYGVSFGGSIGGMVTISLRLCMWCVTVDTFFC